MDINITTNIEQFIRRLDAKTDRLPAAIDKGLSRWAVLAHAAALKNLSGSNSDPAGSFPVPVRTGNLRRKEGYVLPGTSKNGFTAKSGQALVFNDAKYASNIHEGMGRHSRFGKRQFALDAVEETREEGVSAVSLAIREALMA